MARKDESPLHIGVLPWLATGHLTPFFHLSTRLGLLGHRISYLSTPDNLSRLPSPLPANLHAVPLHSSLTNSVMITNTADLSASDEISLRPHIRRVLDSLSSPLLTFIQTSSPPLDWLLCDYSPYWAPQIARSQGVKTAYLSLFSASVLAFLGPANELMHTARLLSEDFTVRPKWVPFMTSVAFKPHEAKGLPRAFELDEWGLSEPYRFGATIRDCDIVAVRSCTEFEENELELLKVLYEKPVLPIGHFPPATTSDSGDQWTEAFQWLDLQVHGSVVYVAFGSEVRLTREEIFEISRGLEFSGLPFIWALRKPKAMEEEELPSLSRGIVCEGWVPQVRFLDHPAIGGFMTHCGWNSVVEGLSQGIPLILVPMIFDQALNARLLSERGVGKEVDRDEEDGKFDAAGIAKALRLVMVDEEGESYRARCRELMKSVLGDKEVQDLYIDKFAEYLKEQRPVRTMSSIADKALINENGNCVHVHASF